MLHYQLTGVIQLLSKCSFFSGSGGKRAPNKKEIFLSYALIIWKEKLLQKKKF